MMEKKKKKQNELEEEDGKFIQQKRYYSVFITKHAFVCVDSFSWTVYLRFFFSAVFLFVCMQATWHKSLNRRRVQVVILPEHRISRSISTSHSANRLYSLLLFYYCCCRCRRAVASARKSDCTHEREFQTESRWIQLTHLPFRRERKTRQESYFLPARAMWIFIWSQLRRLKKNLIVGYLPTVFFRLLSLSLHLELAMYFAEFAHDVKNGTELDCFFPFRSLRYFFSSFIYLFVCSI